MERRAFLAAAAATGGTLACRPAKADHFAESCANPGFGGKKHNRLSVASSTAVYTVYVETQGVLLP
jgi:hypothetical protein